VEDSFFLPAVRSFTRKPGESFLATPSDVSVNVCFMCGTRVNRKEVTGEKKSFAANTSAATE